MEIISLTKFLEQKNFYIQEAIAGKIFIYPTDTIYGIGGIYTPKNVAKVFDIKQRDTKKMFSLIAPDFERINKKFPEVDNKKMKEYLEKYHGITYIFSYEYPGIRIIKHPFQQFVQTLGKPFITTSCNITGEPVIVDIKDIPKEIASKVDYIIDGGIGGGKPSILIDFIENKVIER